MDNELIFVVVIVGFFFIAGLVVFGLFLRVMLKERRAQAEADGDDRGDVPSNEK